MLPADNGAVFSVVVSNEFSSVTSSNATLTGTASLAIVRTGTNRVVLSWQTNLPGFLLESKPSLAPGVWNLVSPSAVIVSGRNVVTNTVSGVSRFYRLRGP